MTNPRDRNQVRQTRAATPKARLPALPPVPTADPAVAAFLNAVKERLEVREGSRGNPFEAVVTKRDLQDLGLSGSNILLTPNGTIGGIVVQLPEGGYSTITVDAFAESIRNSKLYQQLVKRLDDPTRFDDAPQEVKRILLRSIAEEAAARGADIVRVENKIQTETRSLAYKIEEVTAAADQAAAGVRQTAYAAADQSRAVAGLVNQVEARLDDVGGVTVEQAITAVADRATGLEGQYTLKIQAGNKIAGFGLAASSPTAGAATSAFIINADKFAVVTGSDTITDPASPPTDRIPFGVDASGIYINGQVRINAGGTRLDSTAKRIQLSAPTTVFKVNTAGTASPTSITISATLLNGLSGTVNWTVVNGTISTGFPATGASVAVSYANVSTDQVTVRASVTQDSVTYTADFTLYKAVDGATAKLVSLAASSYVFQVPKTGAITPSSITLTATGQNVSGSPTFSVTAGTATLTGTGNTRTLTSANLTTDSATIQVTWDGLTDTVTIVKVREGTDGTNGTNGTNGLNGLTVSVPNDNHSLPANSDGVVSSYTGSGTTIQVFEGSTALAASSSATTSAFRIGTITQSPAGSITVGSVAYSSTTATILDHSAMLDTVDQVLLTIPLTIYRASGTSSTVSVTQTLTKSKAGAGGTTVTLVPPASLVQADQFGSVASFTGIETQAKVIAGGVDETSDWAFYVSATGGGVSYRDSDDAADRTATGVIDGGIGGSNLLLRSNLFTDTAWVKTNSSVIDATPLTAIPAGVSGTPFLFTATSTSGVHNIQQTVTASASAQHTISWIIKDDIREYVRIDQVSSASASVYARVLFDFVEQTLTQTVSETATIADKRAVDLGDGWWLIQVTFTLGGSGTSIISRLSLYNGTTDSYGSASNGIYVLGAQLNAGTRLGYAPTGATARSGTNGFLKIVALSQDGSWIDITSTRPGYATFTQRYSVNKAKQGARVPITAYGTLYGLYLNGTTGGVTNVDDSDPWPATSTNAYRANRTVSNILNAETSTADLTTTTHLRIGDTVTLTNNPATTAQTRYWSGTQWAKLGVVINGNLLVNGTISGDKIAANAIAVGKLSSLGTAETVGTTRTFGLNLAESNTGWKSAVFGTSAYTTVDEASAGVLGVSASTVTDAVPAVTGLATTTSAFGGGFYSYSGTTQTSKAVFGGNDYAGVLERGSKNIFICNASYALYADTGDGKYYIKDGAGPFTGFHDGVTADTPSIGDIVIDAEIISKDSISSVVARYALSTLPNQRGVAGVASELFDEHPIGWRGDDEDESVVPAGCKVMHVNALGEGLINVCGESGNIERGDLIVTSSIPGKGMKQADDTIRSYTVAKSRENVTFASPTEVKQIACFYVAG